MLEGFECCCRAANDEDGYSLGAGQGFELTAVDVGHLGKSATNLSLLRGTTGAVDTLASRMIVEWLGAAVISFERLGFKFNPATNFGTGEASKRSNLCIIVSRTSRASTCTAPTLLQYSACISAMDSLLST